MATKRLKFKHCSDGSYCGLELRKRTNKIWEMHVLLVVGFGSLKEFLARPLENSEHEVFEDWEADRSALLAVPFLWMQGLMESTSLGGLQETSGNIAPLPH